jgi:ferrous iron transport protein B
LSKKQRHIVLVGNPNSGKTTLFNALTGLNQKISNLPGTTIEKKTGRFIIGEHDISITDLPGTYSIHPKGEDEMISIDYLLNFQKHEIDVILFVADASNLSRNLLLYTQVADLGFPTVLALNMIDSAEKKGISIDIENLSRALSVIVCPINAREGRGLDKLKDSLLKANVALQTTFFESDDVASYEVKNQNHTNYHRYLQKHLQSLKEHKAQTTVENSTDISGETIARYKKIDKIIDIVQKKNADKAKNLTQRIDRILLHPIYGFLAFYATLFIIFQFIFKVAEYPMTWIELIFSTTSEQIKTLLPDGMLSSLLADGIIPGIGGVIVFLPQIILLFALLALLEDSGYMTRVSFITDRLMRKFGLNGKSVVPLIGGMACAIPSIMATRNIENKKDRLITILVTPLMSCSARLPVYTLLVSLLIVDKGNSWFDPRGLILLGMYLLGFIAALLFAFVFKLILKQKHKSFFILELPDYRKPRLKNILLTVKDKAGDFVFNAGKIILLVSIVLWFLASFGPKGSFDAIDQKYQTYTGADLEEKRQGEKLEASYAGVLGKAIEPAIKPLGYDWKIGIALITSLAAREVFVGTIATIYSVGDADDEKSLSKVLSEQKREDGTPLYSLATIISLLVFYAFAMQCFSTLAVTYRETGSLKWPVVQMLYMTGFAYLASLVVFQSLS